MLFSPHVCVEYEHIVLKNHRRKLEFFMQKGNACKFKLELIYTKLLILNFDFNLAYKAHS